MTTEFYQLLLDYAVRRLGEEEEVEEEGVERLPDQAVVTKKLKEWAPRLGIRVKRARQGYIIEGFSRILSDSRGSHVA